MKLSTAIIGIVLFAIATMILYGWGIVKQKNQTNDLMNLLFSEGLEAKQPFSRNRAVVKDKRDYAKKLVEYMLKTNQLEKEGSRYKMHKK